jgi:hypothetical protein
MREEANGDLRVFDDLLNAPGKADDRALVVLACPDVAVPIRVAFYLPAPIK